MWGYKDFADLPPDAVAQALSRLWRKGVVTKHGKGTYYAPRTTAFGRSVPTGADLAAFVTAGTVHPSGVSAANILGLTTQNTARGEFATTRPTRPRAFGNARVITDRSKSRNGISAVEGALLEILRDRARASDLDPSATRDRLLRVLRTPGVFRRLSRVALNEPPRVRAILGALGQEIDVPARDLKLLGDSLNPLSRYDFGRLHSLRHAPLWRAR